MDADQQHALMNDDVGIIRRLNNVECKSSFVPIPALIDNSGADNSGGDNRGGRDLCTSIRIPKVSCNLSISRHLFDLDCANWATAPKLEPEEIVQAYFKKVEQDSVGQYDSQLDEEGWSGDSGGGSSTDCQADLTADSHCEESNRKRPRDPIDEGDVFISRLAPGIRKHVKEALDSALLPLVLALRTREENEQEHREKLLALEIEKLDLKRQKRKLLLKGHRGGRSTGQFRGR